MRIAELAGVEVHQQRAHVVQLVLLEILVFHLDLDVRMAVEHAADAVQDVVGPGIALVVGVQVEHPGAQGAGHLVRRGHRQAGGQVRRQGQGRQGPDQSAVRKNGQHPAQATATARARASSGTDRSGRTRFFIPEVLLPREGVQARAGKPGLQEMFHGAGAPQHAGARRAGGGGALMHGLGVRAPAQAQGTRSMIRPRAAFAKRGAHAYSRRPWGKWRPWEPIPSNLQIPAAVGKSGA